MFKTLTTVLALACLAAWPANADAQTPLILSGIVRDAAGAPLPGASIALTRNGATVRTTSDQAGQYEIRAQEAGIYLITVNVSGFRTESRRLYLTRSRPENFTLTLDVKEETVTVSGPAREDWVLLFGVVRNRDTNGPVGAGLTVRVTPHQKPSQSTTSRTDPLGAFSVAVSRDPSWQSVDVYVEDHRTYRAKLALEGVARDGQGRLELVVSPNRRELAADIPVLLDELDEVGRRGADPAAVLASLEGLMEANSDNFKEPGLLARAEGIANSLPPSLPGTPNQYFAGSNQILAGSNQVFAALANARPPGTLDGFSNTQADAASDGIGPSARLTSASAPAESFTGVSAGLNETMNRTSRPGLWNGGLSYYGPGASIGSSPLETCACSETRTGFNDLLSRRVSVFLSTPVIRRSVRASGYYDDQRDQDAQPGTAPGRPRHKESEEGSGALQWNAASIQATHRYSDRAWRSGEQPTLAQPFESSATWSGRRIVADFANLTYASSSSRTYWQGRVSGSFSPRDAVIPNGPAHLSRRYNLTSGFVDGGAPAYERSEQTTWLTSGSVVREFERGGIWNTLTIGGEYSRATQQLGVAPLAGVIFYDLNGPLLSKSQGPSSSAYQAQVLSTTVRELARISDRLTVNGGLRYVRRLGDSARSKSVDAEASTIGPEIAGRGQLYRWHQWEPFVAATASIIREGKLNLSASWRREHLLYPTSQALKVGPGNAPEQLAWYDAATGGYSHPFATVDVRRNVVVDTDVVAPSVDQSSISVRAEIMRPLSLDVTLTMRREHDLIGWEDRGGIYQPRPIVLPDGSSASVLSLESPTEDRRFAITNPEGWRTSDNALSVGVTKRLDHGWLFNGSYTLSSSRGLGAAQGAIDGPVQLSAERVGNFGRDPNDLTNAEGDLPADRRHRVRTSVMVLEPWFGMEATVAWTYQTGAPYAAYANTVVPQGVAFVLIAAPGSNRFTDAQNVDVRLVKPISVGSARLRLSAEVLNLTNSDATMSFVTSNRFSANFGRPATYQLPRRLILGASFGF